MDKTILPVLITTLALSAGIVNGEFDSGTPVELPPPVNLPGYSSSTPNISADRLSLFFSSDMPGQYGNYDLWVTTRAAIDDDWGVTVNLGPTVNSSAFEVYPDISSDGQRHLCVDEEEVAADEAPLTSFDDSGWLNIRTGKDAESGTFWSGLIDDV